MTSNDEALLHDQLIQIGINATEEQLGSLLLHLDLVLKKNETMNLTAIRNKEKGITLHIVDSLLLLEQFDMTKGVFLDLGTGAGFPGIPLSIMSGREGVLLDSVKKKATACSEFIDHLALSDRLTTSSERVEEHALSHKGSYGCVTARAVASLDVLVEYAAPLLCLYGRLIAAKGVLEEEELNAAHRTADLCGMSIVSRETFELPKSDGHREIIVLEKKEAGRISLPRRIGEARKNPLSAK
jgi:16S rRNA (guanine527-N7)-methyltransferase